MPKKLSNQPAMPAQTQLKPGLESNMAPRPLYHAVSYRGASKLVDRVAIVPGGDSDIARAVSELFAREGADVAIVYLPAEQADAKETAQAIRNEGRKALLLAGDVTNPKFCQTAVTKTIKKFGKLDILVNNAAYQQTHESLHEISDEFELTFPTNLSGCFYIAKAALKHLGEGSFLIGQRHFSERQGASLVYWPDICLIV